MVVDRGWRDEADTSLVGGLGTSGQAGSRELSRLKPCQAPKLRRV